MIWPFKHTHEPDPLPIADKHALLSSQNEVRSTLIFPYRQVYCAPYETACAFCTKIIDQHREKTKRKI